MTCKFCIDENGESCYPQYGLAPHTHTAEGMKIETVFKPKNEWPDNFSPDPEVENMGTWNCEHCFISEKRRAFIVRISSEVMMEIKNSRLFDIDDFLNKIKADDELKKSTRLEF